MKDKGGMTNRAGIMGAGLRRQRLLLRLSVKTVAKGMFGVSEQQLLKWERGVAMPALCELRELAEIYTCKVEDFTKIIEESVDESANQGI